MRSRKTFYEVPGWRVLAQHLAVRWQVEGAWGYLLIDFDLLGEDLVHLVAIPLPLNSVWPLHSAGVPPLAVLCHLVISLPSSFVEPPERLVDRQHRVVIQENAEGLVRRICDLNNFHVHAEVD